MASIITLLIGILAIYVFYLGLSLFDSYIVAILFLISAVIAGKSLEPRILRLWSKFLNRYFPLPELHNLYSKGFGTPDRPLQEGERTPDTLGMRVLAMTETLDGKENKALYKEAVKESIDSLRRESELFDLRYQAVLDREAPVEWLWANCGQDGKKINKCFSAWMLSPRVTHMEARQQNRDLFLHDGTAAAPDDSNVRYTVLFLFDDTLPVAAPQTGETPEEAAAE